jgi:hypothetical protein
MSSLKEGSFVFVDSNKDCTQYIAESSHSVRTKLSNEGLYQISEAYVDDAVKRLLFEFDSFTCCEKLFFILALDMKLHLHRSKVGQKLQVCLKKSGVLNLAATGISILIQESILGLEVFFHKLFVKILPFKTDCCHSKE